MGQCNCVGKTHNSDELTAQKYKNETDVTRVTDITQQRHGDTDEAQSNGGSVTSSISTITTSTDIVQSTSSNSTAVISQAPMASSALKDTGFGKRHQLAVIASFGFFNVYALRANLGLTIVAMVNVSASVIGNNDTSECPNTLNTTVSTQTESGEFNWDEETQGIILSSFYYGYIVTQLPGGRLAEVSGPKLLMGIGMVVTSVATLITPVAAQFHVGALIAVRVILGLAQGLVYPSIHYMIGKWVPRNETTSTAVFIYGGSVVGLVVSMSLSGFLCASDFLGGWPSVYYVFGSISAVWCIIWFIFVYDSPAKHPKISEKERRYIESSVGVKTKHAVPYLSILKSPAVWAIITAHVTHAWGYYTILACFPTYLNTIQHFNVTQTGTLMGALYVVCWFFSMSLSIFADTIRRKKWLSTTKTRKIFNTFATFSATVCLVLVKDVGCDYIAVIVLVVLSQGLSTICESGYHVNHIDIAPNFAGTLYGISNTFATASGILSPYIVGVLTNQNQTMSQWHIIFYISAGMYAFGGIVFLIFSQGVIQDWNSKETSKSILIEPPIDRGSHCVTIETKQSPVEK